MRKCFPWNLQYAWSIVSWIGFYLRRSSEVLCSDDTRSQGGVMIPSSLQSRFLTTGRFFFQKTLKS